MDNLTISDPVTISYIVMSIGMPSESSPARVTVSVLNSLSQQLIDVDSTVSVTLTQLLSSSTSAVIRDTTAGSISSITTHLASQSVSGMVASDSMFLSSNAMAIGTTTTDTVVSYSDKTVSSHGPGFSFPTTRALASSTPVIYAHTNTCK